MYTTSNKGTARLHNVLFGKDPPLKIVPFEQPRKMHVERSSKVNVQAIGMLYTNGVYNHSAGCVNYTAPTAADPASLRPSFGFLCRCPSSLCRRLKRRGVYLC